VGNKNDKKDERQVSFEEASNKAKKYGVEYIESSAKLNENVDKAFEILAVKILNNMK
jgi:GTPase SAR1 family protein